MKYRFYTLDVFTDRPFAGNPLAVLPWAEGLDDTKMQSVAKEFNFSETVFVFPPRDPAHTKRVRIFTPGGEIQFAGHPTVGTAFLLAHLREAQGDAVVLEEGVGPVPVSIQEKDGRLAGATLSVAKLPEAGPPPPSPEEIAAALSLDPSDLLMGDYPPQAFTCGTPFLFIPIRDRATLARTRLDRTHWESSISRYWAPKMFIFAFDPELPGSDIRARMFAPSVGVAEDPATGSAASAIAGYLGSRRSERDGTLRWQIEQGFEMGRPSIMRVEADKKEGAIAAVRVGGDCVLVTQGEMEIP
ncbi:MAG TPA: PhzF family phenazine biosynthesis protein [Holophagaceae bacterium]